MEDWRQRHEQHRRVRRWNWRVFSNSGKQSSVRFGPSPLELLLAALLAAAIALGWLVWVPA